MIEFIWPDSRIDPELFSFCTWWPKCEHGRTCPARFDRLAQMMARKLFFDPTKRLEVKKFKEEPDCYAEISRGKK